MSKQMIADFLMLPVHPDEVWQGGVIDFASMMGASQEDVPFRMEMMLWRCDRSGHVFPRPADPDVSRAHDFVTSMCALPGELDLAFRPARIECNDRDLVEELRKGLEHSGTTVNYEPAMEEWDDLVNHFLNDLPTGEFSEPPPPSLREAGCTNEQVREFALAAAEYYRAEVWNLLDDSDLVEIEYSAIPSDMKHALVLGAGGQSYGLGFYQDPEDHFSLMKRDPAPRELNLLSLLFDLPEFCAEGDIELWEELDLPLENAEAFPDASVFSPEGPRRPTPEELVYLTMVLRGLAQTTEEELDSGKWTKSLDILGNREECTFSIPNLLDPPSPEEWTRRGKMVPDIDDGYCYFDDDKFSELDEEGLESVFEDRGDADRRAEEEGDSPRDTPTDRADALVEEARRSFGRRRLLLLRQALEEDPYHIDANLTCAELIRTPEDQIKLFQRTKEAAAAVLEADWDDLVGEFGEVPETRPYMRACLGLAEGYTLAGRVDEAVEQYREMLKLDPLDHQCVRYTLVSLLLEHGRHDEATEVLEQFPEQSGMSLYQRSLAEYLRSGETAVAKKALLAAFKSNRYVPELLGADDTIDSPRFYSSGSEEEGAYIIEELEDAWRRHEDYVDWMLQAYSRQQQEREKRLREQRRKYNKKAKSKRKR